MQRIAIYLDGLVDPWDLQRAFRQSQTPGSRVVTLLQEDRNARNRPVLQNLKQRLATGEFDQIELIGERRESPQRLQQATRGL